MYFRFYGPEAAIENSETLDHDTTENDCELNEKLEDCDSRKTIKVKPFGGPLLAQVKVPTYSNNFYIVSEKFRLVSKTSLKCWTKKLKMVLITTLLARRKSGGGCSFTCTNENWETASAGSRSLPSTPVRKQKIRMNENIKDGIVRPNESVRSHSAIPPSVIHQTYGVAQHLTGKQFITSISANDFDYVLVSNAVSSTKSDSNKNGLPNNAVKHIPMEQSLNYSPSHKLYGSVPKPNGGFTNGDLIVQQQIYNQQMQYQQSREYQQYRQSKEQMLLQQQGYQSARNYQSSVHIPIVMHNQQTDVSPMHRKHYEMT
ncbi:hypothetical protein FQR65_LT06113 [Abscondita terminalis]|nr:hypothetical protein FQR65_LT06113 [Abscondita terminalis]